MIKIKIPLNISRKKIENFFKTKTVGKIILKEKLQERKANQMIHSKAYGPELEDLYRLYMYVKNNKRTTVLEFGSGWSSLMFAVALSELKKKYIKKAKQLRRNNLFELFIVDNEKKYLNISKKRITSLKKKLKIDIKINYILSDVLMDVYNGKICTKYKNLPLCNPDFIYLDGPDQFKVKGSINGISTRHKDMMPMSSDILFFEYFLTPGTNIKIAESC